jgi:uncharacterized protein (DUF58 family)
MMRGYSGKISEHSSKNSLARALFDVLPSLTWRRVLRGAFSFAIVAGGVAAAVVTMYASRARDFELARTGALASLIFVGLMLVFVVPPLMRSARAEAARLDLPVRVTPGGALFMGLLIVVTIAALNTGNNLLFLIFALLFSTLFVAWTAGRAVLSELSISARFADHIFAGEPSPALVKLHNRKRFLPSFSIFVEARLRNETRDDDRLFLQRVFAPRPREVKIPLAYFSYLPHRAQVEQRSERIFEKRGRLIVTGFEVSTRFPFGFFRQRRRLSARSVELFVYPAPAPIGDELHLLPIIGGLQTTIQKGTGAGHELYSLRDYQPQDDLRHIDWKASARTQRLIVREFAAEDERRVHIMLDTRGVEAAEARDDLNDKKVDKKNRKEAMRAEDALRERFERGVNLAASLVAHFIEERAEVRLTIGDGTGEYGTGREHLYNCLRRLAIAEMDKKGKANEMTKHFVSERDQHILLLTMQKPGTLPAEIWRVSHVIYL